MLSKEETVTITRLTEDLAEYNKKNIITEAYYDAKSSELIDPFTKLGKIQADAVETSLSWANIAVEVINERINLEGFYAPDGVDVLSIFRQNRLASKAPQAHREALIFGCVYQLATPGNVAIGEPKVIITTESPKFSIGETNPRSGLLMNFLKVVPGGGLNGEYVGSLYLPEQTIYFTIKASGKFEELSRDVHGLGFVPAVKMVNRPRPSRPWGQSEITRSVKSAMFAATETFDLMRVAAKIYSTPLRYWINVDPKAFLDADGKTAAVNAYMDKMLVISGGTKAGGNPTAGQFNPSDPKSFISIIKEWAMQIAAETGIPESYFGYSGNQPASADALRVHEGRITRRAQDRMRAFSPEWTQIIKYALIIRDGSLPENWEDIRPVWADASPDTPAADADVLSKVVTSGAVDPASRYAARLAGLNEDEYQDNLKATEKATRANLIADIKASADAARKNPLVNATANSNSATQNSI